ncbi:FMN-binding negative transcriptional regulator [Meiothermus granaticius]|uniref:Protease synthase and sporulation protein PAI 2 n=1 Tax=Meiothermus granaticius NBRC 107808 TaxID=1227551 RepID=A0A399FEL6_9DEIN|nr:FMN-binding negative transcriptional regulator [Meiothermus granaticius]RIH93421.1 Protease synthase and sporulation protein PAI 2 [Meiothermus granaticius NBRC 107808]GEM87670.1 transcriptional regulator [Meiothermus granaticius NBRC 107808]
MYLPQHFSVTDRAALFDLMRRFSFATLVSVHQGRPFATHMPFVADEQRNLLSSHIARANPQWTSFGQNEEVLVIFQGHHSFVSPTWYAQHPSVPTWNYLTVHAYGKPRIVDEPEAVQTLLRALVVQYEQTWTLEELPERYLQGMLKGLVAFEVEIGRLEGKFKLSQNRSKEDRQRVIAALEQSSNPTDRALAVAMRSTLGEG